jgi:hypothetical protein
MVDRKNIHFYVIPPHHPGQDVIIILNRLNAASLEDLV